jgi:Ni,Fe-hydrogenase maturation factor
MLIGIGNAGKSDDGLGWSFLDGVKKEGRFRGQIAYRYQLQIEDAALIKDLRQVIFIDAFDGFLNEGFRLGQCYPSNSFSINSHTLSPEAILYLCQDFYLSAPHAFVLKLQGQVWDLNIGLSEVGHYNLARALKFFHQLTLGRSFP